jgi:hypothetical protein
MVTSAVVVLKFLCSYRWYFMHCQYCLSLTKAAVVGLSDVGRSLMQIAYWMAAIIIHLYYLCGCSGTKSTIAAVIYWPVVPALDHRW